VRMRAGRIEEDVTVHQPGPTGHSSSPSAT
jgi:hypothetical protein